MTNKKTKSAVLVLVALLLAVSTVRATTFLQLQSTYLGNGWFQYQMNVLDDPFFTDVDISLQVVFTNQINQSTTSTNWINSDVDGMSSTWSFTNGTPERPFSETFLIQSSETSYRLGTNFDGALALLSLTPSDFDPLQNVYSQNIVGYAWMPCLVPCTPDEADNSPTNYTFVLKLLPDVGINQLIQTNGNFYGIDFTWDYPSTFLLQGSTDLNDWTNVAYVWSSPPETAWTTNEVLNSFGNFFRISLVADGHSTNLPPLNSAMVVKSKAVAKGGPVPPRITGCQFSSGKVLVSVASQPGQAIQIQAVDSHLSVKQVQHVVAQGSATTGTFDAASLPNPVFFQATLVP